MLLADGNDLNPAMLVRWQAYLMRTRKEHDPVFAPWHALAALPEREFAARAASLIAPFQQRNRSGTTSAQAINPGCRPGPGRPAASVAGRAACVYARLLGDVEQLWQDSRATGDARRTNARPTSRAGPGIVAPGLSRSGQPSQYR